MLNKFIPLLMCVIFLSDKFKTFNATKFKNILLNHDTCLQISQFKGTYRFSNSKWIYRLQNKIFYEFKFHSRFVTIPFPSENQ